MPLGPVDFLMVVALPGVLALIVLLGARRMKWGGPVALFWAFLCAFPWKTVMGGFHIYPPRDAMSWMFYVALAGAIGGVIDGFCRWPFWLRALGVFIVSAGCCAISFRFIWAQDQYPLVTFTAVGAIATIWWIALDASEREEETNVAAPWIFWIVTASCAVVCVMFGGLKPGQLIGSLAAASGAGIALSYILRRKVFIRGASMAIAIPLALMLASMNLLVDLKPGELPPLVAAACAPIVILIARVIPVGSARRWVRPTVRVAPVALFMLIVLALSMQKFRQSMQEDAEPDPYGLANPTLDLRASARI